MKKLKKGTIAVGMLLFLAAGIVYAAENKTEILNSFSTGIVDIEIKEDQSAEIAGKEEQVIMPGAEISKALRIKNRGSDCYVRLKINSDTEGAKLEQYLYGIEEKWIRCGDGYLYYPDILKTGEEAMVFQGLKIPEDFSQEYEGSNTQFLVNVDAIQSKNFSPDFSRESPWGLLEIQKCEKEGAYNLTAYSQANRNLFQITYQGESKSLVANQEDFFANFPMLFPGDVYEDSAELKNNSNTDISLYLRTEAPEDCRLLEEAELEITAECDGKSQTVYHGNLRAAELEREKRVAFIPKKGEGKLMFRIRMPKELQNEYTDLRSYVKWIFSTSPEEEETVYIAQQEEETLVQTGDTWEINIVFALLAAALAAGLTAVFALFVNAAWPKKGRNDDE